MREPKIAQTVNLPEEIGFYAEFPGITPEELFDYFIKPELLIKWWSPEAVVDAHAGGVYTLFWPAMQWELYGYFTEYQHGERLGFSWKWKHLPDLPARQVTIVFQAESGGTSLHLTHRAYTSSPVDQEDRQSHINGWSHYLHVLQNVTTREGVSHV